MASESGMGYKLVVFEDGSNSRVENVITGFDNARDAAHYRDTHFETAGKVSQIQIDHNNYVDDKPRSAEAEYETYIDYGQGQQQPRQVVRYHEKRPHSLVNFLLAFVIVAVIVFLSCPVIMAVVGWLFRL